MPELLSAAVGREIRRLMTERDVSAYALSKSTGIPQSTLSRKFNGAASFDFDDVQKIAPVLSTDATSVVRAAERSGTNPTG
ncbi:helix-turn-helix domain-containing protein [Modestobacter lapidis]|nr:helix-turn-helix transcriptional regulator [Modestobacter lapidis]